MPRRPGVARLEREAEHDLRDPHESRLNGRLPEVGVADRVGTLQRAHVDAVEQVELFDLQLRHLAAAQTEYLDDDRVDIRLPRRAHRGDRSRCVAVAERRRHAERGRVDPRVRRRRVGG